MLSAAASGASDQKRILLQSAICGKMMVALSLLVVVACDALSLNPPASIVALGPGATEVKLIAAKLAAKAGFRASVVVPAGDTQLRNTRALLYGRDYAQRPGPGAHPASRSWPTVSTSTRSRNPGSCIEEPWLLYRSQILQINSEYSSESS